MSSTHTTRPAQEKVCGYEYTVKRGDSFYLIANRLGVPLRDLLAANADVNPARLMVGDVLCIPMEEDDQPAPDLDTPAQDESPAAPGEGPSPDANAVCPESQRYTVAPNQSAADIQLRTGLSRHTLQTANPAVDLDALQPGQILCVPEENIACPARMTYILRTGETLESLALTLNVSISSLLRSNPCLAPGDFTTGVCVTVP